MSISRGITERYPDLDHYLSSVFIQDYDDHRTLEELSHDFASHSWTETVTGVIDDIERFLREQHNGIEAAFDEFGPQVEPTAWNITIAEWLALIAKLLAAERAKGSSEPNPHLR